MVGPFWRIWALGLAIGLCGCVRGEGAACERSAECEPGLACVQGACATCGDGVACVAVDLVASGCDPETDPLDRVSRLRITTMGEGMSPESTTVNVTDRKADVTGVPLGRSRRIVVEGLASDGYQVLSRGSSAPFDVGSESPVSAVTIYLRRANEFADVQRVAEPGACRSLVTARAGHSATRLKDGRVLIVGGFDIESGSTRRYLDTAEIYDPATGEISLSEARLNVARHRHTATLLADGRVLVAGGIGIINHSDSALSSAELFDPQTQRFTLIPMRIPRSHHAAALLPSGVVLLSGGVTSIVDRQLTDRTEFFSPSTRTFGEGPRMTSPRAGHAAVAMYDSRVFIIGGSAALGPSPLFKPTSPLSSVDVFLALPAAASVAVTVEPSGPMQLGAKRSDVLAASMDLGDGRSGVLVVGPSPVSSKAWDWLATDGERAPDTRIDVTPTTRLDGCIAISSGGLLLAGGRSSDGLQRLDTADLFSVDASGRIVSSRAGLLGEPRSLLACTALADGTVLVTGGETASNGTVSVSARAEIYNPAD